MIEFQLSSQENTGVEPDWETLADQVDHSIAATKTRFGSVAITQSGGRINAYDAILDDPALAKKYHGEAELEPTESLCEKARVMECMDHGYNSKDYTAKRTDVVPGLKGAKGPDLHMAAATISRGKRPPSSYITRDGKKRSTLDASHLCKRACCINPVHLTWESHKANVRRISCVGRIRLKIGNKYIMANTKECKCVPRCIDYSDVAI